MDSLPTPQESSPMNLTKWGYRHAQPSRAKIPLRTAPSPVYHPAVKAAALGILCLLCSFLTPPSAHATPQYSLLLIDSQEGEPYKTFREELHRELAALGFEAGKNLSITSHSIGNKEGRAHSIWGIIEKDKSYNAVVLNGTVACTAFKKIAEESSGREFIFASVTDPVGLGLIQSFNALPSGNFTGVAYPVPVRERLRIIKKVFPNAHTLGLIDSDMPQSTQYRRWLNNALTDAEFKGISLLIRTVPFVGGEGGTIRMAMLAQKHVEELDPHVDIFLSPNDQMGISEAFSRMVDAKASHPLIGLTREDVEKGWGATMSVAPDQHEHARYAAAMIARVFQGTSVKDILPIWPQGHEVFFNSERARKFGISTTPPN